MVNKDDMKKALDALNAQLLPKYAQIALKFSLQRTTLMRQHQDICTSVTDHGYSSLIAITVAR